MDAAAAIWMAAAISGSATPPTQIAISVEQFRASPPTAATVRIAGYVIDTYRCPPCPKGAMCKPCITASAVYLADNPPAMKAASIASIGIEVSDPTVFQKGGRYLFSVQIENPYAAIVGRALEEKPIE